MAMTEEREEATMAEEAVVTVEAEVVVEEDGVRVGVVKVGEEDEVMAAAAAVVVRPQRAAHSQDRSSLRTTVSATAAL